MPAKARKSSKRRRSTPRVSSNGRKRRIDPKIMQALIRASHDISKNSRTVKRKLRAAGVKPELPLVVPTALYFEALDRLAQE